MAAKFAWPGDLDRYFARACRAVARGMGPPTRAGLGDITALVDGETAIEAVAVGGPCMSRVWALTCIMFLLREIEGSLLTVGQLIVVDGPGLPIVCRSPRQIPVDAAPRAA